MIDRITAIVVSFSKPKLKVFDNKMGMSTKISAITKVSVLKPTPLSQIVLLFHE